jgi:hypothetical protein
LAHVVWHTRSPLVVVSVLLGLGFTFSSGAVEAWLVDALTVTGYTGSLEAVFGRGMVVTGIAMFVGSVLGGVIAQMTDLGVPFLLRAGVLVAATRHVLTQSVEHGLLRVLRAAAVPAGGLRRRVIIGASLVSATVLVTLGLTSLFWLALMLLMVWGFAFAAADPVRQAYLNAMIPSAQRATVLSFDSLFGSLGGVVIQPGLGRVADVGGYSASLLIGGIVELIGIPFVIASRRQKNPADAEHNNAGRVASRDAHSRD